MCTIIKVKRKITDDPVDCLILECKKKKIFIDEDTDLCWLFCLYKQKESNSIGSFCSLCTLPPVQIPGVLLLLC